MKKILLIGASGTIGQAIYKELTTDCDIITVGYSSGDYQVDLGESSSIKNLYDRVGKVDAVVCAAARGVVFEPIEKMTRQDFITSMQSKLLGQIELVTTGLNCLEPHVSFTLTTGILNGDPIARGTAAAMVNSGVEAFAYAAALDVAKTQRINVVSPALLTESKKKYDGLFPGYDTVPAATVARAYRKLIFGRQNGHVLRVGW